MAKKKSRPGLLATLEYPVKVEIRAAEFKPYASLQYLDVSKLRRGNHKIEVGSVKGGCCGIKAFGIIKAGVLVAVKFDPCEESKKPLSKSHQALVEAAFKKVATRRRKWVPVRVDELFGKPAVLARFNWTITESCLEVCWGDLTPESPRVCITCCATEPQYVCSFSRTVEVRF